MVVSLRELESLNWQDHCYGEGELKEGKRTMQDKEQFTAAKWVRVSEKERDHKILKDGIITHQFVPHIKNIVDFFFPTINSLLAACLLKSRLFFFLFMFFSNFFYFFWFSSSFFYGGTAVLSHMCIYSWAYCFDFVWLYGFFSVASLFFYLSSRTCINKWIEVAQKNKNKNADSIVSPQSYRRMSISNNIYDNILINYRFSYGIFFLCLWMLFMEFIKSFNGVNVLMVWNY